MCNRGIRADAPQPNPSSACWADVIAGLAQNNGYEIFVDILDRWEGGPVVYNLQTVRRTETVEMLAHGRGDEMLDTIFERYEAYARGHQLVLVEGTHEDGPIGEASVEDRPIFQGHGHRLVQLGGANL